MEAVAIGDFKMRETNSRSKFIEQRKEDPPFKTVVEMSHCGSWRMHEDVARAVDDLLNSRECRHVTNARPFQCADEFATFSEDDECLLSKV